MEESASLLERLEELYYILFYGLGIADLGIAGVVLVYGIIAGIVTTVFGMLISLLVFILQSVPLYKITKKLGRKSAFLVWLSWIPVIGGYITVYVVADALGEKPLRLTDKVVINNRLMSFWIYTGIAIFGPSLITALIATVNVIPGLGQMIGAISTLLYLAPAVALAWIEYAYLRDILDVFNENQKANRTAAIIVAVVDALATFGIARAFYLYTVMNKKPLPQTNTNTNTDINIYK